LFSTTQNNFLPALPMLTAYLCTRRGRTAVFKASLGILAFSYGGLISSAALDALRLQADALFIEAQAGPDESPQPLYFQGEAVVPSEGAGGSLPPPGGARYGVPGGQGEIVAP